MFYIPSPEGRWHIPLSNPLLISFNFPNFRFQLYSSIAPVLFAAIDVVSFTSLVFKFAII